MDEDRRPARGTVLVDEREGRRRHLAAACAEPLRQAAHELGLARPERTGDEDDVAGREEPGETAPHPPRRGGRAGELFEKRYGHDVPDSTATRNASPSDSATSEATSASSPTRSRARSPDRP